MFKKTMTFDNVEGEETTQTFYFNYTKKEIMELLEFKNLEENYKRLSMPIEESGLTQQQNNQQAYDIFQDLILDAYGQKSADGNSFDKNEELRNYFKNHMAFSDLVFEFVENPDLMHQFMEACVPPKLVALAKEELAKEAKGELKGATLSEMVQEAEKRQKDPATRIEPGPEAAHEALAPTAPVEEAKPTAKEDLTPEDIRAMDDDAFAKLDVKGLSQPALVAAFQRKSA